MTFIEIQQLLKLLLLPLAIISPNRNKKTNPKQTKKHKEGSSTLLLKDLSFLLIRFNKHTRLTDEMRIPTSQYGSHSFSISESNKPIHPLLLIWYPHIFHSSKVTTQYTYKKLPSQCQHKQRNNDALILSLTLPEIRGDVCISEGAFRFKLN